MIRQSYVSRIKNRKVTCKPFDKGVIMEIHSRSGKITVNSKPNTTEDYPTKCGFHMTKIGLSDESFYLMVHSYMRAKGIDMITLEHDGLKLHKGDL